MAGETPLFYIDSANRRLLGGKNYEITHIGNRTLGWMLSAESVRIRITQDVSRFRMIDPASGLEEDVILFKDQSGMLVPRTHNGIRFTDSLHSLRDCDNCNLID